MPERIKAGIWQLCFTGLQDKNNLKSSVPCRLKCRLQQRYGLCGTVLLKCFESYLCNRTQFLNKRVLSVGVPQGSVLGPVLYPIHTSPLSSHANKTHFRNKGCVLGLILKVRVFGTRKWPIEADVGTKAQVLLCA